MTFMTNYTPTEDETTAVQMMITRRLLNKCKLCFNRSREIRNENKMFLVVAIGCSFLIATNPVFTCVFLIA